MITYKNNQNRYKNVWFTSDEHYGNNKFLSLAQRLEFDDKLPFYKHINELDIPTGIKRMLLNTQYGISMKSPVDIMNDEIISKHNMRVGKDDLVFHLGDFGEFKYSKCLSGHHVLIMGDYEYEICNERFNGDIKKFRDIITIEYNFIDVVEGYVIRVKDTIHGTIQAMLKNDDIGYIYMTHKPTDCKYGDDYDLLMYEEDNEYVINLFGHIHETAKIKRFGINVGVDTNHFYPMSMIELISYIKHILYYYDKDVFI